MIRENERLFNNLLSILDVFLTLIAFIVAYYVRIFTVAGGLVYTREYLILGLLIIPVWFILLKINNIQTFHRVKPYSLIMLEYFLVTIIGLAILFLLIFIFKLNTISRLALFIFGISDIFLLFVSRIIIHSIFKRYRKKGFNIKNVLLIADENSENFIKKMQNRTEWGFKIYGIITDSEKIGEKFGQKHKLLPQKTDVRKLIDNHVIDEVVYCKSNFNQNEIKHLIYTCQEVGVAFRLQSDFFNLIASKSNINYFGEIPVLTFANTPSNYFALKIKDLFDFVFSLSAIIFLAPVFLIISILIKTSSKGAVFFKQKRVGKRGRIFTLYKFRTMVENAEELKAKLQEQNEVDGPVFKIKDDPRITKIGKFLRKTSLDELPQFINVLKGDMSIVGARPPVPEEVEEYERWQLRRLSMKPGITCIWQVSGRNNISFEEWMKLDLEYIDNWSLKLDMILILKTINTVFRQTGY